jgi:hypothetical protein
MPKLSVDSQSTVSIIIGRNRHKPYIRNQRSEQGNKHVLERS